MKRIVILGVAILGLAYMTYKFMNSREYQLFGNIVSHVETNERVIALTFDDGPTESTEEILKILEELEIKATFFLNGNQIENYPEETKRIVESGNEIGNHTYSHQRNVFKSPQFIKNEILKTNELIREAGYEEDIYFRSPFCKKLLILPYYINKYDMVNVTFDVEPETYYQTIEEMVDYAQETVKPGSIILLHPMYQETAVEAIKSIVESLKALGYDFITISELMMYQTK